MVIRMFCKQVNNVSYGWDRGQRAPFFAMSILCLVAELVLDRFKYLNLDFDLNLDVIGILLLILELCEKLAYMLVSSVVNKSIIDKWIKMQRSLIYLLITYILTGTLKLW